METKQADKVNETQKINKNFLNFVKTKKAKLLNEPLDYDSDDDTKQNPFKSLKGFDAVIL